MAKAAMSVGNMRKNLTLLERSTREKAESDLTRIKVKLTPPEWLKQNARAFGYWKGVLKKMRGISLLDDVDADMLAIYCDGLARCDLLRSALVDGDGAISEDALKLIQAQERLTIQYADKLGLTPSGRARLAKKRAEERAIDEADELFV